VRVREYIYMEYIHDAVSFLRYRHTCTRARALSLSEKRQTEPGTTNIIENVRPRDRKGYLNNCYQQNKEKIEEQIKVNEKNETYKIRLIRELKNGLIDIKTVTNPQLTSSSRHPLNIY